MELRFTLKDSEIFQGVQWIALRRRRNWAVVLGMTLLYSGAFTLIAGHWIMMISALPIFIVVALAAFLLAPFRTTKKIHGMGSAQQVWTFKEKITIGVKGGKSDYEWDYFDNATEGTKWFFLNKERSFYIFPKTQMNDASVEHFRELLVAKGKL